MKPITIALGLLTLIAASTSACGARSNEPAPGARADFVDANGNAVGSATLWGEGGGVRIRMNVTGLPPGEHGFHIHAVGRCDPPDFQTAGGHFNPVGKKHGSRNPEGPHAGDLPNLTASAAGTVEAEILHDTAATPGLAGPVTLESLFDADGSALVMHAAADDYTTDPAGNAGARIACAVIRRP